MELTLDSIKKEVLDMVNESYETNIELLDLILKLYLNQYKYH